MPKRTDSDKKKKFPIISVYFLGFIISIFFEFYWINYFPYDYFMLFGIGIILCIFGYLTIDALVDMIQQNAARREAQNEVMIKASKAIYVTAKKIITETQRAGKGDSSSVKNLQTLINDLTLVNEQLAKEIETAASLQKLNAVTDDTIVNTENNNDVMDSVESHNSETVELQESNNETIEPAEDTGDDTDASGTDEASETGEVVENSDIAETPETTETTESADNQNQKLTEEQIAKMFADL